MKFLSNKSYDYLSNLLLLVGFHKVSDIKFKNGHREVEIIEDGFSVSWQFPTDKVRYTVFSSSHNMYWIIGALAYNKLIPKEHNLLILSLDLV